MLAVYTATSALCIEMAVAKVARLAASCLILLALNPVIVGYVWGEPSSNGWSKSPAVSPVTPRPQLEEVTRNVAARVGQTVTLPCRVRYLGDKLVSWIRSRDLHILTSGPLSFTADPRFLVVHPEGDSAAWSLQLRAARTADQGLYECQVNTDPKLKHAVLLTVSDGAEDLDITLKDDSSTYGHARILGPAEQYVRRGSTVTFTCEVDGLDHPLPQQRLLAQRDAKPARSVDWLHGGQLINYHAARGGVSIETERAEGQTWSRLTLVAVEAVDAGVYTCRPYNAPPARTTLLVLEGERTAAMQGEGLSRAATYRSPLHVAACFLLAALLSSHWLTQDWMVFVWT